LIDGYNKSYPNVAGFLARQVESVRERGFAETLLGRRRYIPDINARNRVQRAGAERIAFNMPIQGTQADMIKIAMIAIHDRMTMESLRSRMLLQVHDELVFEVAGGETEKLIDIVRSEMIVALPLDVPIEVDISVADNWLDAH
jgi:DNA polymerase-1